MLNGIVIVVLIFFVLAAALGAVAYFTYQRKLRRAKAIERGLKMVPILIHLPPPSSDTESGSRDIREVMREKTAQAEVLYNLIAGTATEGFKSNFYGQRHVALELIAIDGVVHFFAAVPVALVSVVKKAIQTAYPGARLEETEDHNIFNQEGRLAATLGGEMVLRAESAYPVATYAKLERDPMEALLTTISALEKKDGVAVQIMLRPASSNWTKRSIALADAKRKGHSGKIGFSAMDLAKAAMKAPSARGDEHAGGQAVSNLQLSEVESIEEKTKHPGFEVLIRVIVSTGSVVRSQQLLRDIATAFALFEAPGMNGFKFLPALDVQGLVTAFIFRFFPPELKSNVLNSVELATLFHLPDSQFTPSTSIARQQSKQVDGPIQLPTEGLLFGYNDFRGINKEIRLSPEDRRRHTYILGQTGTGKSTMLENLAVQDMQAGNGFAFIDPHGDSAEKLLALVPKSRAEDIVYFNPGDTQYPLGLNLFEFNDPAQKDFLVQETINMLYKLYDPGHTGIIGPRYEHWYRNAALTLMSDPNGATFIEIPKVFTDTEYLKQKFKYLRDPTVIDFWTKEMGQTSDYHKSEMLGWFVSKFGAFQNNEMMRNIIGQTKSSFNIREIMDNKKILIVNLSKGRIGELNSQLLGMIFVIKFQAAAMSRADMPEADRKDFSLYVDEFQNFSTDSFASILSEARKYRLNLIVANQFIGQLSDEIRDAVFGNIGTIVAHRMGPEDAEFMVKQFAPVFDMSDLINIPNYNAAMRLMIGGLPSQPFSIRDLGPLGSANLELGLAVKQLSAAKYGHAKAMVEADILDRMTSGGVTPLPTNAPGAVAAPNATPAPAPMIDPMSSLASVATNVPDPAIGAVPPMMPAPAASTPPSNGAPVAVAASVPVGSAPAQLVVPPVSPAMPALEPASVPATVANAPIAPIGTAVPAPVSAATMPGMAAAPPPIGAPPVGMPPIGAAPADLSAPIQPIEIPAPAGVPLVNPSTMGVQPDGGSTGSPVTNTAGQVMASVPNIIPEDNLSTQANEVSQNGLQMATTPPPIGAPPIGVEPIPLANSTPTEVPLAQSAQLIEPPPASVAPPLPPEPVPAGPPPIGAPPMELASVEPTASASKPVSTPGTLSLSDITGGKPLPQVLDLASVSLTPQGSMPLPTESVVPEPEASPIVAQPIVPLGSGHALETDPYANIDVLGDLTPPMVAEPVGSDQSFGDVVNSDDRGVQVDSLPLVSSAEPLPNDPYAGVDVLGAGSVAPQPQAAPDTPLDVGLASASTPLISPVPVQTPDQTYASSPNPASVPVLSSDTAPMYRPVAETQSVEALSASVPLDPPVAMPTNASDVWPVGPAPITASQPPADEAGRPNAVVPNSMATEPSPGAGPASMIGMSSVPAVAPAPAPALIPAPIARPTPTAWSEPTPLPEPASLPVAQPPAVSAISTPAYEPNPAPTPAPAALEPVQVPEPMVVAPLPEPATVPTPAPAAPAEPLIHFVDPGAQAILDSPVLPDAVVPETEAVSDLPEPSLDGLPEGVQLVKPTAEVATAPELAAVAQSRPEPAPAPSPAPISPAVMPMPSANAAELPHMETTPPPIGAAPVALPPVSVAVEVPAAEAVKLPAPILVEPTDAEIAKAADQVPIPEMNAPLVEALKEAPVVSVAEVEAPMPEEIAKLESVAEMLDEAHDQTVKTEAEPAPVKEDSRPEVASPVDEAETTKPSEPKVVEIAVTDPKAIETTVAQPTTAEAKPEEIPAPTPEISQVEEEASKPNELPNNPERLPEPVKPVEPIAPVSQPDKVKSALSTAQQIEKAEHEIDDLLSVSLIKPESTPAHHRLPEPIVAPKEEDSSGVDLELNAGRTGGQPTAPKEHSEHLAEHHGLKVIQPLEPIVPPKERFAKELAALANTPVTASVPEAPVTAPVVPETPVVVPVAPIAPTPAMVVQPAVSPKPALVPEPVKAPEAAVITRHGGELLPSAPAMKRHEAVDQAALQKAAFDEDGLPQAESLAADDVARARADREAQRVMQKPAPEVAASAAPVATVSHNQPLASMEPKLEKPESEALASAPIKPVEEAKPAESNQSRRNKRRRLGRQDRPAEHVESEAEAEHNKPTEAMKESAPLTGKLILPTEDKPKPEPVQPKTEKPKKLAPGEVYVDDSGNVIIGE